MEKDISDVGQVVAVEVGLWSGLSCGSCNDFLIYGYVVVPRDSVPVWGNTP